MTNREYIQSLSDEEFAKYLNRNDTRNGGLGYDKPHICDYKHEGQKRCKEMNDDCHACMVDFLRAEHIEEVQK